ncbi:MAG: acetyl-CoA carboxylase, biotin carboxyl carrier protein [Elusimicrobia bacterium]|nr:acetyl-CoA carboxylase, biotin carboxyl carrier protein [Elusimicrobiota bacterium]
MAAKDTVSKRAGRKEIRPAGTCGTSNTAGDPCEGVLPKLKEVYGFMTEHQLDTVEVEEPGLKLRLVRRAAPAPAQVPVPVFAAGMGLPPPAGSPSPSPQGVGAEAMPANCIAVKSSMMGIFYRAPTPSSPPFAKEGDGVKPGQVLCIIEAMKVFNELKAEFPGTVVKVLVENGKPVKAGQDVFWIQRA